MPKEHLAISFYVDVLGKLNACRYSRDWLCASKYKTYEELWMKPHKVEWLLWLIFRLKLPQIKLVLLDIFNAVHVKPLDLVALIDAKFDDAVIFNEFDALHTSTANVTGLRLCLINLLMDLRSPIIDTRFIGHVDYVSETLTNWYIGGASNSAPTLKEVIHRHVPLEVVLDKLDSIATELR